MTLMDVIECEKHYPGLVDDLFVWRWQYDLIKEQLNDEKGSDGVS